ncbi:hypothetical protein HBI56_135610 [Parastagonospora nodorum]|uniref:Uncharacterized protein n=2 Tax=Phaeosphaeria nodorum (strain SN15 / ATCC MYA-4574 / FGSC 10173) TaxID=321614 RepID=A0A7U2I1H4_PHANO|nr:hypothetical protein SNOG_06772 [Parastagonospora nodorum SN15]KAH3918600.1 hypothetical protein HBH56_038700 [Parastagonospora nodorum]EAT85423.2 hypothetical protein SNOG_06772 [Parastagonospora nodorum SN15]KAH3933804.1 hypothetical protein HBH54_060760 [Parastagonospora nodorum]KAH3941085.1 hypothetical protein HBH53_207520 [Parastagonospora nodorum]KAH3958033.1 hypothetical protein HBH51_215210 [Parastagonospora nodorum]
MPRGSPENHIKEFIESIPDSKLTGTFGSPGANVFSDTGYRLDMQNYTSDDDNKEAGIRFNLQVQVNFGNPKRSVQKLAPGSVAWILLPVDDTWTPKMIRDELLKSVTGYRVDPPKEKKEKVEDKPKPEHKHNPNKSRKR